MHFNQISCFSSLNIKIKEKLTFLIAEIKTNRMRKAKAIYSQCARARESATTTCVLVKKWANSKVKKGKASGIP